MNPRMLVEFVDGSKTMVEMAAIANATGLVPDKPGMHGPACSKDELSQVLVPAAAGGLLSDVGRVDFTIGKGVAPGVFCVAEMDHPRIRERMEDLKMGDGPYFTFFRPYHLTSLEVPLTCARVVLYGKADMVPMPRPVAEVCAVAKRDLRPARRSTRSASICYRAWIMTTAEAAAARGDPLRPADRRQGDRADQEGRTHHPGQRRRSQPTAASPRSAPARTPCSLAARRNSCGSDIMTKAETPSTADNRPFALRRYSPTDLRAALKKMYLIRRFEEGAEDSYMRGMIHGTMHLCIGQEASGGRHLHGADRRRQDHLDPSRPRPLHRQGRRGEAHVRRILRQGGRLLPRPRRLDAHRRRHQGQPRRQRHRRRRPADRRRRGARRQAARSRRRHRLLLRRRRQQRGRLPRVAQHGGDLEAAGDLRLREQPIRHVDLDRALDGREAHQRPRRRPTRCPASPSTATTSPPSPRRCTRPSPAPAPARARASSRASPTAGAATRSPTATATAPRTRSRAGSHATRSSASAPSSSPTAS